jgi:hypothetical protein
MFQVMIGSAVPVSSDSLTLNISRFHQEKMQTSEHYKNLLELTYT